VVIFLGWIVSLIELKNTMNLESIKIAHPSTSLEQNIKCAQEAIEHTVRVLPMGAANVVNNKVSWDEIEVMRADVALGTTIAVVTLGVTVGVVAQPLIGVLISCGISPAYGLIVVSSLICPLAASVFCETFFELQVYVARSYKMGNCAEHARIACDYLKKITTSRVEVIIDFANDHSFVVIGRDPKSSLNNPSAWGSSAVICDSWARESFSAFELKEKMAHIFSTHLSPPQHFLRKENFGIIYSYEASPRFPLFTLFSQYIGRCLATVACLGCSAKDPVQSLNSPSLAFFK